VLTRVIPYLYEDPAWHSFWWTPTPVGIVIKVSNHLYFSAKSGIALFIYIGCVFPNGFTYMCASDDVLS
jgi:hypothetical protein